MPQPILDILAEMIAVDSSINVSAVPESEPVE
jgi:import receptor subunit TOM20